MKEFLNFLLSHILDSTSFTIEETEEDGIFVFTIFLQESDYPVVIGKKGMTIKAISALCRVQERAKHSLNGNRFYIKVENLLNTDSTE